MFDIVLVAPEIPQNTGTIGRLCVCTGARLNLIEPLGFSLDESRIRRAGMDYWQYLDLAVHRTWEAFISERNPLPERMLFASTKARATIYRWRFENGDCLIFGNEGKGLPDWMYTSYKANLRLIPMPGSQSRSHNLANAVSIVLYEGLRQVMNW